MPLAIWLTKDSTRVIIILNNFILNDLYVINRLSLNKKGEKT
jgi:hypothetical protein